MVKSQFVPDGIVCDIFSRLPCKSVFRFKSGCKSWYCFISDPSFTTLHFNQSSQNLKLLINSKRRRCFRVFDLERSSLTSSPATSIQFPMESHDYYSLTLVGSSCGLVCVAHRRSKLYLWNPFTREVQKILGVRRIWNFDFAHGFGYDPASNKLKLLVASKSSSRRCDVFSMESNSCKSIKSPTKLNNSFYALEDPRATVANGVFHWLIKTPRFEIIGFDLKENKFLDVDIPQARKRAEKACLLEHKGHLCMSFSRAYVDEEEIWMFKNNSWTPFLRFSSSHRHGMDDPFRPICIGRRSSQVILHNKNHILRSATGAKRLEKIRTSSSYNDEAITCFETLISPNHFIRK